MAIGQSSKTRQERLLQNSKSFRPSLGHGFPKSGEGTNGDLRINSTPKGMRLFIKFNNRWVSFKPEEDINIIDNDIQRSLKTDTEEIHFGTSWANVDTTEYGITLPLAGSYLVYGTFLSKHDGDADAYGKVRLYNNTLSSTVTSSERKLIDISASIGGAGEMSTSLLWKVTIPCLSLDI